MNQEIIRIRFDADGHPEDTVLFLAIEGELSDQDADQIESHTRGCRRCQMRRAEVAQGLAVYEEYHTAVLPTGFQPEPTLFSGFPTRLRELSEERTSERGVWKQTLDVLSSLFRPGLPIRWVSATAVVMVVVFVVTQTLLNPVRLSAAELLERAAASQNPSEVRTAGGRGKTARQRVRIWSGGTAVVRDFQWTVGSSIPNAHWKNEADPEKWNAPLTAEGFSEWRNSVTDKNDQVKRTGEQWTLDTTARGSAIREAWIVVRASDFHPTEQHIRFSDDRSLDFEELAFDVTDDRAVESPAREAQSVAAQQPANRTLPPSPQTADPNETELEVRHVMFEKGWDLNEDLEIARTGSDVAVSGAASSAERAQTIREALGQIPGVRLEISSPPTNPVGEPPAAGNAPASKNPTPLLKDTLEKVLPIPEQRRDFVDRCLAASDNALAHASVLRKLAERYDATIEAALTPASQARLREILREHLDRLRIADAELDPLIQLLTARAAGRVAAGPSSWRDAMQALFAQVREQDSLVTALVAGSQNAALDVSGAPGRMKLAHESVHNLLLNAQALVNASGTSK
jgi:hypothetical protein